MFIIVDGLDGSGKSTVTTAWREMFAARGKKIFDAVAFEKTQGRIPTIVDAGDAEVIVSAEPTYAGVGKYVRNVLIKTDSGATAREITEGFSEQRRELYEALIIPAIERGLLIIQDRGITSSLCYQAGMSVEITEDFVAALPGNQLAIERRPDYVIICDVPADVAMKRLGGRSDKMDEAIFERRDHMERVAARFSADSWKEYLRRSGTQFVNFNANQPIALAIKAAQHLILDLIGE